MTVKPLRRTISSSFGGLWGREPAGAADDVAVVRVADFDYERLVVHRAPTRRALELQLVPSRILRRGDLLVEKSGGGEKQNVGRVVEWTGRERAICSNFVNVLRPHPGTHSRWLVYVHRFLYQGGYAAACTKQTTGIQNLDLDKYLSSRIAVPPPARQAAVADFLDRECDRLREIQRRLGRAALVSDEQRLAVIERLTHGPPIPLKHGLAQIEQGWSPECEASLAHPGAWGVLKAGAPNYGDFSSEEHKALPSHVKPAVDLEVRVGDVLMSRANTRDLVGSTAVVESTGGWRLMLCDKLYRLAPRMDRYRPRYLAAALSSRHVRGQIETGTAGASASMQNITQELVRQLRVPCPPVEWQARVEAELATDWRRRLMLRDQLKDFGDRVSEYRDALITEAVTGKLDVTRLLEPQLHESAHAAIEGERPEVLSA